MKIFIVFASQLLFGFSRTLNNRYVAKDNIFGAVTSGLFVKILWLLSTYLGISSIYDGDYIVTCFYVIGGVRS